MWPRRLPRVPLRWSSRCSLPQLARRLALRRLLSWPRCPWSPSNMVLLIYICSSHTIVQQRVSTHVFADVEFGLLVMINSSTFFATKPWAIQTSVLIGLRDVQPQSSLLVCKHLYTQISMMMYTHAPTWKQSLIRRYITGLQVIKCWDGEAMIDPAVLDIENSDITSLPPLPSLRFVFSLSILKRLNPDDDSYTADFICESLYERKYMVFFLPRGCG